MKQLTGENMRPLLLLEINEVPWRVVDKFKSEPRFRNLGKFFSGAATFTTITVDKPGMLDPWVTWPSLHRGMDNSAHNVKNLGQDPDTFKGTPIWEEFRKQGLPIGIFGSFQSWPPKDPGGSGFYIPDTFAHDEACIPKYIEPFQKFNLGQVARNGRVIKGSSIFSSDVFRLLASLPRLGISFRTMIRLAGQLLSEIGNRQRRARRPIFQGILAWDIFKELFVPEAPPAFSTFFTNHVASIMHRYWKHIFPEDFGEKYSTEPKVHLETMNFAIEVVDEILGDAMGYCERNPDLILVFATSMGQKAILHDWHEGYEASIPILESLMTACGLKAKDYKPLLAMVPQVAIKVPDSDARTRLRKTLEGCRTQSDEKLFVVLEIGSSLSITSLTPKLRDIRAGGFMLPADGSGKTRFISWEDAGMVMNQVEPGTAYHFPEGVMAVYGKGVTPNEERKEMRADEVKEYLMRLSGLQRAEQPKRQLEGV